MAGDRNRHCELEQEKYDTHENVKIICLGDSAVGKSKLLGYSRPGAVPEHACFLLPQGSRLHHGI
uniref:RAB, member RAS oncogene family-like 2 n=1 Tax=Mus musculus TaxID=10090 RepID=E9Q8G6_MOUSE